MECQSCGKSYSTDQMAGPRQCHFCEEAERPGDMANDLISKMQAAARDYLKPDTYVRRLPGGLSRHETECDMPHEHSSALNKEHIQRSRDRMFIADIIYFLDSEEHGTNAPSL